MSLEDKRVNLFPRILFMSLEDKRTNLFQLILFMSLENKRYNLFQLILFMSYDVIPDIISFPRDNEIPPPKNKGNFIPTILLP